MKRSGQIALVLMGVTTATAFGYYALPRNECRAEPPKPTNLGAPAAGMGVGQGAAATDSSTPCRTTRPYSSRWYWGSRSSRYSYSSTQPHTALAPGGRSGAPSIGRVSTPRGGFGSIGHSFSFRSGT